MSEDTANVKHYFVDEAGDPVLFDARGRVLIGTAGCSRYFAVGLLDVADPIALGADLNKLRADLLADPYFKDVPSMQPDERKTALYFHAKDDLPEVRREVFKLLQRHPVRFSAVVRDKQSVLDYVRARNQRDAATATSPTNFTITPSAACSKSACINTKATTFASPFAATVIAPRRFAPRWKPHGNASPRNADSPPSARLM